jgi:hypothetical protein
MNGMITTGKQILLSYYKWPSHISFWARVAWEFILHLYHVLLKINWDRPNPKISKRQIWLTLLISKGNNVRLHSGAKRSRTQTQMLLLWQRYFLVFRIMCRLLLQNLQLVHKASGEPLCLLQLYTLETPAVNETRFQQLANLPKHQWLQTGSKYC